MFFIINPRAANVKQRTFGFPSTNNPPQVKELKHLEDDIYNLIASIKYKPASNEFQKTMKADKEKIMKMEEVIVPADKTPNLYKMDVNTYRKKLTENITKDYRKSSQAKVEEVTAEAAKIARELNLDERMDTPTESEAFITIKDHKDSFPGKVDCRLINPAKNHVGRISKDILDRLNTEIRKNTGSNQWQSTTEVIKWFNRIPHKSKLSFFKFDIVAFYPSISEDLLMRALYWAQSMTKVTMGEINTIIHCRRSFLYHKQEAWVKKTNSDFDVGMGSLDSAEVCELVGLYILHGVEKLIPQENVGLYRDDGLGVTDLPGPDLERLKQNVICEFKKNGLKITVETGSKITDFLDISLNLNSGTYRPFRKDPQPPVYIHKGSNHPPHIKKELPKMIGRRISQLSSSKEVFLDEAPAYTAALRNSGYSEGLDYTESSNPPAPKRTRKRKVLWFNPPWNDAVATNVAGKFLQLIDKHFPKGSQYHKYFNRNTVKVSYSCMPNMASIINAHNKKVAGPTSSPTEAGCNCRGGTNNCPLNGKCLTKCLVYKCKVTGGTGNKEYIGLTATSFKERYSSHTSSFNHESKGHSTALSSHIWDLKKLNTPYSLSWSIIRLAPAYSRESQVCQLCLVEKTMISLADCNLSLNKRNEIVSKCRHRDKWLLRHW